MAGRSSFVLFACFAAVTLGAACELKNPYKGHQGLGSSSSSGTMGEGGSGGQGGGAPCDAPEEPLRRVAGGVVTEGTSLKVSGVVAMSEKFLVSQGGSGACLWGVFVSEPGLAVTKPFSGLLVTSYGANAPLGEGGVLQSCPSLGEGPVGGAIPDDVAPGDVLDVVGVAEDFLLPQCADQPAGSRVAMRRLAEACRVSPTGKTAPLPTPHAMAADDVPSLSDPEAAEFHAQWAGVKVEVRSIAPVLFDDGESASVTDPHGAITLASGLRVIAGVYARAGDSGACHAPPEFADDSGAFTFTAISGFSVLDFCRYSLAPSDKCADFSPPSEDCAVPACF